MWQEKGLVDLEPSEYEKAEANVAAAEQPETVAEEVNAPAAPAAKAAKAPAKPKETKTAKADKPAPTTMRRRS